MIVELKANKKARVLLGLILFFIIVFLFLKFYVQKENNILVLCITVSLLIISWVLMSSTKMEELFTNCVPTEPFAKAMSTEEKIHSVNLLKQTFEILEKYKIDSFLFYGTLLGQQRHGGFIPWDDDIDITVDRNSFLKNIDNIKRDLSAKGIGLIKHNFGADIYIFKTHYKENPWPFIDLFFFDKDNGYINLIDEGNRVIRVPDETIFPLQKRKFENEMFPTPNRTSELLDKQYPGWKNTLISSSWNHRLEKPICEGNIVKKL